MRGWLAALIASVTLLGLAACDGKRSPAPPVATNAGTAAAGTVAALVAQPAAAVAQAAAPATATSADVQTTATPSPLPTRSAAAPALAPEPLSVSLTPVSDLTLSGGFNADVWAYNGFAYVGSYGIGASCPATGVRIVDVHDPANPMLIGAVADISGTSQEKVIVRHVSTSAFSGDLLAAGVQRCGKSSQGGVALYDVTNPLAPIKLAFFATGPARGVHELDLVQQGSRVLALLAVPSSESNAGGEGDFRIVDVSDPRNPVQLSDWGVHAALGVDLRGGIGCSHAIFDHSARASADANRVYLSYWDAGVIVLDISDPTSPTVAGRIEYGPGNEGETHSVAEAGNGRYLLIADEDGVFQTPLEVHFRVQTADGPSEIYGCEALFSKAVALIGAIDGEIVAVGSGCAGRPFLADPRGRVALVDEGSCSLDEQASRLQSAGARAIIVPQPGEPVAQPGGRNVDLPVVTIRESDGADLRQTLGTRALPVTLPSEKHASGLRIWEISNLSAPRQLAVYQTADSTAFPPVGDGAYTIHNPESEGDLAFLAWYSDGLRVLDISNPSDPREVASYVPQAGINAQGVIFPNDTLVWGVHLDGDLIFLSDINTGLHIVRYSVQR